MLLLLGVQPNAKIEIAIVKNIAFRSMLKIL
jgi:hypothetical protein